jgi:hypothetical protein
MMPRATWNGAVLAEAPDDRVQIVEGIDCPSDGL